MTRSLPIGLALAPFGTCPSLRSGLRLPAYESIVRGGEASSVGMTYVPTQP